MDLSNLPIPDLDKAIALVAAGRKLIQLLREGVAVTDEYRDLRSALGKPTDPTSPATKALADCYRGYREIVHPQQNLGPWITGAGRDILVHVGEMEDEFGTFERDLRLSRRALRSPGGTLVDLGLTRVCQRYDGPIDVFSLDAYFSFATQTFHSPEAPMSYPVFRVTMLGKTGSGKTVYMHALYQRFITGAVNGLNLHLSDPATRLRLHKAYNALIEKSQWPDGSSAIEEYNFELMLHGKKYADIRWIDYRGGVWDDPTQADSAEVAKLLRDSDAIMVFVDMHGGDWEPKVSAKALRAPKSLAATSIGLLRETLLSAKEESAVPKAWVFVRPKSDFVQVDGRPSPEVAVDQLLTLLGDLSGLGNNNPVSAIAISASGSVNPGQPGKNYQVVGDDPINVEWPVLQAVSDVLRRRSSAWRERVTLLTPVANPIAAPTGFFNWLFGRVPDENTKLAKEELDNLSAHIAYAEYVANNLVRGRPASVKIIRR